MFFSWLLRIHCELLTLQMVTEHFPSMYMRGQQNWRGERPVVFAFLDSVLHVLRNYPYSHEEKTDVWCTLQYFLFFKDFITHRIPFASHQRDDMVTDWHRVELRYYYSEPCWHCNHWSKTFYLLKRYKFHLQLCYFYSQRLERGCRSASGRTGSMLMWLFKIVYHLSSTVCQLLVQVAFIKVDLVLLLFILGAF